MTPSALVEETNLRLTDAAVALLQLSEDIVRESAAENGPAARQDSRSDVRTSSKRSRRSDLHNVAGAEGEKDETDVQRVYDKPLCQGRAAQHYV